MPVVVNFPTYVSVNGLDTSDANATESQILEGYTAYVNNQKITGSIPSLSATSYTPSIQNQTISMGSYLGGEQVILGDEDLIPSNIKNGIEIFGVTGTFEGETQTTETMIMLDCRDITSTTGSNNTCPEVVERYGDIIKTSSDGSYATFTNLTDYVYETVSAIYQNNLAGITFKAQSQTNMGFYSTVPINNLNSHFLIEAIYYVSTWINPTINIHFISANSIDEIPTKITAGEYVWSGSITLSNTFNSESTFFEFTDAPIGEYYVMFDCPTATGGNEALINYLGFLNI